MMVGGAGAAMAQHSHLSQQNNKFTCANVTVAFNSLDARHTIFLLSPMTATRRIDWRLFGNAVLLNGTKMYSMFFFGFSLAGKWAPNKCRAAVISNGKFTHVFFFASFFHATQPAETCVWFPWDGKIAHAYVLISLIFASLFFALEIWVYFSNRFLRLITETAHTRPTLFDKL